jgi:hypothetical protein
MEKRKIKKVIFWSQSETAFTWKDIKGISFEDDDQIQMQWVEPHFSENESNEGYFICEVSREVEESDEEFEKRMKDKIIFEEEAKKKRYENYLKLKEEFEAE